MQARLFFVLLGTLLAGGASAAEFERISRLPFAATGTQAGETVVEKRSFSADGRFFLFASSATAVLPGVLDLNGRPDLFVQDLQLGSVRLVTQSPGLPNLTAGGGALGQRLSANGQVVVFASDAQDLIPIVPAASSSYAVYWRDLASGATRLVCHPPGQPQVVLGCSITGLAVSADGRYVLVETFEDVSLFIPAAVDANGQDDLLVWDSATDTYELVSHVPGDPLLTTPSWTFTSFKELSADGRYVAYTTRNPWLVPGDSGQSNDLLLYDRETRSHRLVSHASGSPGAPANADAWDLCALSPDGRYLLFESAATNLIAGVTDLNSAVDLFLFDRVSGAVELISRTASSATTTANAGAVCGWMSEDVRYIYFRSWSNDLLSGVTDGSTPDLFLRDRQAGSTRLVTRTYASASQAAGSAADPLAHVAADGGTLIFHSSSESLVNASYYGGSPWSFRYELGLDQVALALPGPFAWASTAQGRVAALSPDGATSVFLSPWSAWLTGAPGPERDRPVPVVHTTSDNRLRLLAPAAYAGVSRPGYGVALSRAAVSGDGSKVVFRDGTSELCGRATNSLCFHDRAAGTYTHVSHPPNDPQQFLSEPVELLDLSEPDARFLLVQTWSPLLAPVDTNNSSDLFLYDTIHRSFELISGRHGSTTTAATGRSETFSWQSVMTPDAGQVAFDSWATDLVAGLSDTNNAKDVFFRDRASGATHLVSRRAGQPLVSASGGDSDRPLIAAQGNYVVFESYASDLVPGFVDGNGSWRDLYLFSAASGTVTLITHAAASPSQGGNDYPGDYFISANGRFVAYFSESSDLAAGVSDSNATSDAFLFDRATGQSTLLSHAAGQPNVAASGRSTVTGLSSDGRYLLMRSEAADLLPGLVSFEEGLFLLDTQNGDLRLVSERPGQPGASVGIGWSALGSGAERVYFGSDSADVLPGMVDTNGDPDIFVWEKATGRLELVTARYGSGNTTANDVCHPPGPNFLFDDNRGLLLHCYATDLLPHASSSLDFLLATFPQPLFADGFESGDTTAWSP